MWLGKYGLIGIDIPSWYTAIYCSAPIPEPNLSYTDTASPPELPAQPGVPTGRTSRPLASELISNSWIYLQDLLSSITTRYLPMSILSNSTLVSVSTPVRTSTLTPFLNTVTVNGAVPPELTKAVILDFCTVLEPIHFKLVWVMVATIAGTWVIVNPTGTDSQLALSFIVIV